MKNIITLFVLVLFVTTTLNAQNAKEAIQNTNQITEGKKNLERDTQELKDFNVELHKLKEAVSKKNQLAVNNISQKLIRAMEREVGQSGNKSKKAQQEISQSSAEVRSDRREIDDNKKDSNRGRYDRNDDKNDMARDQANSRDDRRDRVDDMSDFNKQIERTKNQAEILQTLKTFDFTVEHIEREDYIAKKRAIKKSFKEFVKLMKEDIEATKRELAEDNREQREDSRERQDDRNERNEKEAKRKRY